MSALPSWRSSLFFRLSMLLGGGIAFFWILGVSLVLVADLQNTQADVMRQREALTHGLAAQQGAELQGLSRDVWRLFASWRSLSAQAGQGDGRFLAAKYIKTDSLHVDNPHKIHRTLAFVEAYGSGGLGNHVDTFVVLAGGIVISSANNPHRISGEHLQQLLALRQLPSYQGLIWGQPQQLGNGRWLVTVAKLDPASQAVVGVTVQLSTLFGQRRLDASGEGTLVWLGRDLKPLTPLPASVPADLLTRVKACNSVFPLPLSGMRVMCTRIWPLGWYLVDLYPLDQMTAHAVEGIRHRIPAILLALLLPVTLIYLVLHRSLGQSLRRYVNVISPQEAVSDQQKLPEGRTDELGQISQAYNRLLDAIRLQYSELEGMVASRTIELDKARRLAEQASVNKSEHLASIAHEIRTPLNGIVGALMLLERSAGNAAVYDLVDTALKCSTHLLDIINNLLDFSRIEAGQMVVSPSQQHLLPLLDQVMLTVQLPAQAKKLMLLCHLEASCPQEIKTDGLRLRQILINLLGNAVKFTQEGAVQLTVWSDDGKVFFSIQDTGPGIPPDKFEQVFTAFSQLDGHVPGSGLGLSIARSLAMLLGGSVDLLATHSGSCFQLQLPIATSPIVNRAEYGAIVAPEALHRQLRAWGYRPIVGDNPLLHAKELAYLPARLMQLLQAGSVIDAAQPEQEVLPSFWSLKVLIADDIDTNRDIVGQMLTALGHQVYTAASGDEALALGRIHVFDLLLTDIRMPGLSGCDIARYWRDASGEILDSQCPVIALTANANPGERERLLRGGFNEYLSKPVSMNALADMLDFVCDFQFARDIELKPNPERNQPLLASHPDFLLRASNDVRRYYRLLGEALQEQDLKACLVLLHSFRGLAGQAGLSGLQVSIDELGSLMKWDEQALLAAWEKMGNRITREFGEDVCG